MNETLFEIFISHRNWYDYTKEPTDEEWMIFDKEMRHAADDYVRCLLSLPKDMWINIVEEDVAGVNGICRQEPPFTHFSKTRQKYYRDGVRYFLNHLAVRLQRYFRNDIWKLQPVTLYMLGNLHKSKWKIEEELAKEDAHILYNNLKRQGLRVFSYRVLCSELYTVIGCPVNIDPHAKYEEDVKAFKMIYGNIIKDMDGFLVNVKTMTLKEIKDFYILNISGHGIDMKHFFNDGVLKIVPWRKNETGFNYENLKKKK